MPPAARGHQTLSAYISARFDEFSRSQKDVAQYVVDHLDEVAFHTAEELARRASTSLVDGRALQPGARASRASRSCRRRRVTSIATTTARRADAGAGDAAVQPRPVAVRAGRRRRPRQRRGHGAARVSRSEVDGAIEAIAAADRILIAGTDQMAFFASYLRHLLMLLDVRAEIAAEPVARRRSAGSAGSTSTRS